jgi:hypothetical protein
MTIVIYLTVLMKSSCSPEPRRHRSPRFCIGQRILPDIEIFREPAQAVQVAARQEIRERPMRSFFSEFKLLQRLGNSVDDRFHILKRPRILYPGSLLFGIRFAGSAFPRRIRAIVNRNE